LRSCASVLASQLVTHPALIRVAQTLKRYCRARTVRSLKQNPSVFVSDEPCLDLVTARSIGPRARRPFDRLFRIRRVKNLARAQQQQQDSRH
jgi:hypothetical protein